VDLDKISKQAANMAKHAADIAEIVDLDKVSKQASELVPGRGWDFDRIAKQAVDMAEQAAYVAERLAAVADAARGKGARSGGGGGVGRWLLLPAAGVVVYAVAKSGSGVRDRAKDLAREATERASEIQDLHLVGRVKEVAGLGDDGQDGGGRMKSADRSTRSPDSDELERNRRERAQRRQRRRTESTSG
jgi:hypothetical protein